MDVVVDAWMDHILAPFLAPVLGSAWFFEVRLDNDQLLYVIGLSVEERRHG